MPQKRQPRDDKNATKYFVPPVRRIPKESIGQEGPKYFTRTYPFPEELPEIWDGTGPDLPEGYAGGEACPDCSAFKFSPHAPLCIRNPNQKTFHLPVAWEALHTKEQLFFGIGHPILSDVDSYMTREKQERLARLNVVVLYDYPVETVAKTPVKTCSPMETERTVIAHWRERKRV